MSVKSYVLALSLFSTPLSAALPPVWQGIAEVKAIVSDPTLDKYLDSADILEGIYHTEEGWIIKTNRDELLVEVVPTPQSMPGPMHFELKFHPTSR